MLQKRRQRPLLGGSLSRALKENVFKRMFNYAFVNATSARFRIPRMRLIVFSNKLYQNEMLKCEVVCKSFTTSIEISKFVGVRTPYLSLYVFIHTLKLILQGCINLGVLVYT